MNVPACLAACWVKKRYTYKQDERSVKVPSDVPFVSSALSRPRLRSREAATQVVVVLKLGLGGIEKGSRYCC